MSYQPTISASIIAQNEEAQLPGLLAQLDWVDDIVVVDGGSTDATVQIAESFKARVFHRRFDNFARQQSFALQKCSGDWILSIDADERPTPSLVKEIRRRLPDAKQNAFRIPIRSRIFGRRFRFSGTQDDRFIRLVRKNTAHWEGDVHEVLRTHGAIGVMAGWMEHETLPTLQVFMSKMERYTRLAAEARISENRPPRWGTRWIMPPREVFRRLIWKLGFLDGPEGWAFCFLSGLSEWVQANQHRRLWALRNTAPAAAPPELIAHSPDDATMTELILN